jgi:hypothetical protein
MDFGITNPLSPALKYLIDNPGCTGKVAVYDRNGSLVGVETFTEDMVKALSNIPIYINEVRKYRRRKLTDRDRSNKKNNYMRAVVNYCESNGTVIPEQILQQYSSSTHSSSRASPSTF